MIDSALSQLTDQLHILRKLSSKDRLLKGLHLDLSALSERSKTEARMIRVRIGLESQPANSSNEERFEFSQELPKGSTLSLEIHQGIRTCTELCRTLEEYFRFFGQVPIELSFKKMRFELYDYERQATALLGVPRRREVVDEEQPALSTLSPVAKALEICPLYFILDESFCERRDPLKLAYEAVAGGTKMMQMRFKRLGSRQLLDLARKLKGICAEGNCLLFVNDRPDIALLSGATGVHLGQSDLSVAEVRQLGSSLMVGVTTPTKSLALEAQANGAAYVGVGAIFSSRTKLGKAVVGVRRLATVANAVDIPVVGIGGITLENFGKVLDAGAAGVCSISPFNSRRSAKNIVLHFKHRATSPRMRARR